MKISIITLFPEMITGFFTGSIVGRAQEKKLVEIELVNLRDFAVDDYGSVDDRPYGGGPGMILRTEPLYQAISKIKYQKSNISTCRKVVLTSPRGARYTQKKVREYAKLGHLILIAGHYEGVDERVKNYLDEEISLGDFVLTGGEIAAAAIVDSVVRLIPGVLKKEAAVEQESFSQISIDQLIKAVGEKPVLQKLQKKGAKKVSLLEYPQYTRPEVFRNLKVPKVLLSGDHRTIEKWRLQKAFELTLTRRKDLLEKEEKV